MKAPSDNDKPALQAPGYLGLVAAVCLAAALAFAAIWIFHRPGTPVAMFQPDDSPTSAPSFELTDQSGATVRSSDLQGKVWIANFVFTNCAGPCPAMSAEMAALSKRISGPDVRFVSFSVDPTRDRPEVLKEYASRYDADHARWLLLTEPATSYLDLAEGFRVMAKPSDGSHPIIHSERFFLVDRKGNVRGSYLWSHREDMDRLVADANAIQSES